MKELIQHWNEQHKIHVAPAIITLVLLVMIGFALLANPTFVGYVTVQEQFEIIDNVSMTINETTRFNFTPTEIGLLQSLKVSGSHENRGTVKIYLEHNGTKYLLFTNVKETAEISNQITGFATVESELEQELNISTNQNPENNPPKWYSELTTVTVQNETEINLNNHFTDEDNDQLSFSTNELELAAVRVYNNILLITPQNNIEQTELLTIAAYDGINLTFKTLEIEIDTINILETNTTETIETNETIEFNATNTTDINQTLLNNTNNESATNETTVNEENLTKTIDISLEYKQNSIYDIDDNGIETTDGIIDLTVEQSAFNWNYSEENLCTRWNVQNKDTNESTFMCYGAESCCGFLGLQPSQSEWDAIFYNYYGLYGAGKDNNILAQIASIDYNLSEENPYTDIVYSEWKNKTAQYYIGAIPFIDQGVKTSALLGLNETNYTILIEIENSEITIKNFKYIIEKDIEINEPPVTLRNISNITIQKNTEYKLNLSNYFSDIDSELSYGYYDGLTSINVSIVNNIATLTPDTNFTGIRYLYFTASDSEEEVQSNIFRIDVVEKPIVNSTQIIIGKPVEWRETLEVNEKTEVILELPGTASNISVTALINDTFETIDEEKITVIDLGENKTLEQFEYDKETKRLEKTLDVLTEAVTEQAESAVIEGEELEQYEIAPKIEEITELLENRTSDESSQNGGLGETAQQQTNLITGAAIGLVEDTSAIKNNETLLVVNESVDQITVEYVTQAPAVIETAISNGKQIKIVSEEHYINVSAYTDIPDTEKDRIKLYWIQNDTRVPFTEYITLDTNLNGLVDRLEWVVPHLSNQTFEVEITVLNVQSYPTVGGNWTVRFTTNGTANLTIEAVNTTYFTESYNDNTSTVSDLLPLSLTCGAFEHYSYTDLIQSIDFYIILENGSEVTIADTIGKSLPVTALRVSDYSCNETAEWTVKVLTPGVHNQRFNFSGQLAYANNYAFLAPSNQIIDFHEDNFTAGTFDNTTLWSTGAAARANVTIDNFTAEIRAENHDGNDVSLPGIDTSGLIAYWRFNNQTSEGDNDTLVTDQSYYLNDEKEEYYNLSTYTPDRAEFDISDKVFGEASTTFDDVDDFWIPENNENAFDFGTNNFSFSFWVKGGNANEVIFCKDNYAGDGNGVYIWTTSGNYGYWNGASTTAIGSTDGEWHHVGVSREGTGTGEVKLYYDGKLTATATDSRTLSNAIDMWIGVPADSGVWFAGKLDEVTVWNRSLSGDEVKILYQRSLRYGIQHANFTSQTFDTGDIANFTQISWSEEIPYQTEIGRSNYDVVDADPGSGGINTSKLVLLMHFNNESQNGENNTHVFDFSPYQNNGTVTGVNETFGRAFNVTQQTGVADHTASTGWSGWTARTIIEAGHTSTSGERIRIQAFAAPSTENMDINKAYICDQSSASTCVAGTVRQVTFDGGNAGTVVNIGQTTYSDWIDYPFDASVAHLVSFYFTDSTEDYIAVWNPGSGTNAYYENADVAKSESMGSPTSANGAYIVGSIEVNNTPIAQSTGKFDGSFEFDGAGRYIDLQERIAVNNTGFTTSAWVYADDLTGAQSNAGMGIIASHNAHSVGDWMLSTKSNGSVVFAVWENSGNDADGRKYTQAHVIQNRTWHHIVGVYGGTGDYTIYVDGVSYPLSSRATSTNWGEENTIGRIWTDEAYHWDGLLDEVAVWNRTLDQDEVLKLYKRGVLRLNITTRVSNDSNTWTDWSNSNQNATASTISETARYLQYRAIFETDNANYTPILNNVTINYSSSILSEEVLIPTSLNAFKDRNVTLIVYNVTDNQQISSVNFTLIDPSGTIVVAGRNASNNGIDGNWNITYNLTSYGPWLWNVSVFYTDGIIVNITTQEIILMEISAALNPTSVPASDTVFLSGHINLSNNTNVTDTYISLYLNEASYNFNINNPTKKNVTDTSDTDFNAGTLTNATVRGSGSDANVTLNNFTAEIRAENHDGNDVSLPGIDTSGLIAYWRFNNQTSEGDNDTLVTDQSYYLNDEKEEYYNLSTYTPDRAEFDISDKVFGEASTTFDDVDDFWIPENNENAFDFGTNNFSFSFWVKGGNANEVIFCKDNYAGTGNGIYIWTTSGNYGYWNGATTAAIGSTDGEWHHVGVSREGTGTGEVKLYYDGKLTATATDSRTLSNAIDMWIGVPADTGVWFAGKLDEVTVWNRSVSAKEMNILYERGKPYGIQHANFTSQTFDAGGISSFTKISWSEEVPYQKEIGRSVYDINDASLELGGVNTSGLVLLMHFNNESEFGENDSLVKDFSVDINNEVNTGTRNNATCTGTTCPIYNESNSKFGQSLNFDGTDDYFEIPDDQILSAPTTFTVASWIYPTAWGSTTGTDENYIHNLLTDEDASGITFVYRIGSQGLEVYRQRLAINIHDGSSNDYESSSNLTLNTWQHGVVTFDGSNVRFYINGKLDRTQSAAITPTQGSQNWMIGSSPAGVAGLSERFYEGMIDELAYWNKTLSSDEVLKLYKRGVLRLNLSTRVSNDSNTWTDWSSSNQNASESTINERARYLQYRAHLETENANYTPILNNVTINFTGLFTDGEGNYNYTFTAPSTDGTYSVKVNTTWLSTISGETIISLTVAPLNSCSCPSSNDWTVDATDNCYLSTACDMQGNDVTCSETGTWEIASTGKVENFGTLSVHPGCSIICRNTEGCFG